MKIINKQVLPQRDTFPPENVHVLGDEQKHDRIERVAGRILEDETGCNPDRVNTRQRTADLDAKHAQGDKEQDNKGKAQQDPIEGL